MIFINFEPTEPPWFSFWGGGEGGDTGLQLSLPSLGQPVSPPPHICPPPLSQSESMLF